MSMPALSPTDIPITHIQLWLQVLTIFVSAISLGAGAAWGGAKLAMRTYDAKIDAIEDSLELILEAQKERRVIVAEIQRDLQEKVPLERCTEDRMNCGQLRTASLCEMGKQVARLTDSIDTMNDKREKTKDEVNAMFMKIMEEISLVKVKITSIDPEGGGL
jgi:hypothetical protein